MRRVITNLLILIPFCGISFSQTIVTGTLLGNDGKPMLVANVELRLPGDTTPRETVEADSDGKYSIAVDSSGIWMLLFTGVNHSSHQIAACLDKPGKLKINVQLAAYQYIDTIATPGIEGDFNNYNISDPLRLQRQPDGTFTADVETKADSVRYEIVGITKSGHTINGTESERYELDNGGDYWSILTPRDGKVHIVFDPARLVRSDKPVEVTFADSESTAARFSEIYEEMQDEQSAFAKAVNDYRRAGGDMEEFRYDRSRQIDSVQARIGRETDGLIRQELLLYYLELSMYRGTNYQIETLWDVLNSDSAASPIWAMNPPLYNYLLMRVGMTGDEYQQHVDQFIRENPSAYARSCILYQAFVRAKYENNDKKALEYYKILTGQYADSPYGKLAQQHQSPVSKIRIGNPVPDFSIPSLGDSSVIYTNATFKGKYYMIDFWATWCGPCVMEMKYLDKAFERFKGKGFEILSVSLDESPQDVVKFRNGKWPMPWLQAFQPGVWNSRMVREFDVNSIPNSILVGPDGKVMAIGSELRGNNLETTLAKFLGH
jgi:thiol-disulfide isomerase/thioredoxin